MTTASMAGGRRVARLTRFDDDWYDMSRRSDGTVSLVVGDVVGHGVEAATLMGQLSSATRALALTTTDPAHVVEVLDRLAAETPGAAGSALVYADVDPASATSCYCRAGHPPPLLRLPDGRVLVLDDGDGPPLAAVAEDRRARALVDLPPGNIVFMYTDGLIEWRDEPLDDRLATLEVISTRHAGRIPSTSSTG